MALLQEIITDSEREDGPASQLKAGPGTKMDNRKEVRDAGGLILSSHSFFCAGEKRPLGFKSEALEGGPESRQGHFAIRQGCTFGVKTQAST